MGKSFSAKDQQGGEQGNAVVYVLIVVALFAALSFILSRQGDSTEQGTLSAEKIEVQVSQIIQVSNQVKRGVDQLIWSGTDINDLDFILPSDGAFDTGSNINKVFHPEGGGIVMPRIPSGAVNQVNTDPAPGWYMGRFNNVEWTPLGPGNTAGPGGIEADYEDVILVAHQVSESICARINEMLTGSSAIPSLTTDINSVLIDAAVHTNGPNVDLDTTACPGCDGMAALCVENAAGTIWSYYNILAQQ